MSNFYPRIRLKLINYDHIIKEKKKLYLLKVFISTRVSYHFHCSVNGEPGEQVRRSWLWPIEMLFYKWVHAIVRRFIRVIPEETFLPDRQYLW